MYSPGAWATEMLPTRMILPTISMARSDYLKRNFSALGFTYDNYMNETIILQIQPIMLHPAKSSVGKYGERIAELDPYLIDDFTKTQHLWNTTNSRIVRDTGSSSGFLLKLTCAASTLSSCGPNTVNGGCPSGCVLDGEWCQSVKTSYVNRL